MGSIWGWDWGWGWVGGREEVGAQGFGWVGAGCCTGCVDCVGCEREEKPLSPKRSLPEEVFSSASSSGDFSITFEIFAALAEGETFFLLALAASDWRCVSECECECECVCECVCVSVCVREYVNKGSVSNCECDLCDCVCK